MKKFYSKSGFALIEVLVGVFILVTVGLAVAGAFISAIKSVAYTKTIIAATALANEEMEILHNLPYDDLATDESTTIDPRPDFPLAAKKTVSRENFDFDVYTVIESHDDPFDGLGTDFPPDTATFDYKKVSISITLHDKTTKLTTLATNIGAKAAETEPSTGVLMICAINSHGAPVQGATVAITNNHILLVPSPRLATTGASGCVMIPNLPPDSHNRYHVEVTYNGYSTDMTYDKAAQNPHALKPDMNVPLQGVETGYFVIDELSQMNLQFVDTNGTPIPNVAFTMNGSKLKYNTPDTPIFEHDYTATEVGADGQITIPDLEFDDYTISGLGSYHLIALSTGNPIPLQAGANLSVIATLSTTASDPTITSITPNSDQVGQTTSLVVLGSNFQDGLVVKLYRIPDGGGPRVEITGVTTFIGTDQIQTNMNLSGATIGKWNLEIVNPDTKKVVAFNSFEVTN